MNLSIGRGRLALPEVNKINTILNAQCQSPSLDRNRYIMCNDTMYMRYHIIIIFLYCYLCIIAKNTQISNKKLM